MGPRPLRPRSLLATVPSNRVRRLASRARCFMVSAYSGVSHPKIPEHFGSCRTSSHALKSRMADSQRFLVDADDPPLREVPGRHRRVEPQERSLRRAQPGGGALQRVAPRQLVTPAAPGAGGRHADALSGPRRVVQGGVGRAQRAVGYVKSYQQILDALAGLHRHLPVTRRTGRRWWLRRSGRLRRLRRSGGLRRLRRLRRSGGLRRLRWLRRSGGLKWLGWRWPYLKLWVWRLIRGRAPLLGRILRPGRTQNLSGLDLRRVHQRVAPDQLALRCAQPARDGLEGIPLFYRVSIAQRAIHSIQRKSLPVGMPMHGRECSD